MDTVGADLTADGPCKQSLPEQSAGKLFLLCLFAGKKSPKLIQQHQVIDKYGPSLSIHKL